MRRYFVRQSLAGDRLELHGNEAASGRLEFALEPSWVPSRLFAVVFVQVDAIPPNPPGGVNHPSDPFGAAVVPIAVLVTGTMLAVMIARFITTERRARLR